MTAPRDLQDVWNRFVGIPCETFSKGWWYSRCPRPDRQRTVAELCAHRREHGTGGNCFDLTYWLLHDLRQAGFATRAIGHELEQYNAHVALLVAHPDGREYLCDLGDVWRQPIAAVSCDEWQRGFASGYEVRLQREPDQLKVECRRSTGSQWTETYELAAITDEQLHSACNHSQSLLRRPFCQMLLPHPKTGTLELWQYDREASYFSLDTGKDEEPPCTTRAEWIRRIHQRSGISEATLQAGFEAYDAWAVEEPE